MNSEDDIHDAESNEDFYSGNTSDDNGDGDYDFVVDQETDNDSDEFSSRRHQQNYSIMSEADIRQRQEDDISRVSNVLSISRGEAGVLLRHYNWSISKVHDEWFADEEKVRNTVGLLSKAVVKFPCAGEVTCGICFDTFPREAMSAAFCGHPFCNLCWSGYVGTAINDGPGCLGLRCPDPSCSATVGEDIINAVASEEDKEKYAVEFAAGSGTYDQL